MTTAEDESENTAGLCGNWTPFGACLKMPKLVREELNRTVPYTTAQARAEDRFRDEPGGATQ